MHTIRTKFVAAALGTALALGGGIALSQAADAQGDRMQQREERLQAKVDDGAITQERADAIRARMAERAERRADRAAARAERADDLAVTLGISVDELTTELRAGNSLADIAEANGVEVESLIDQIEAARIESIERAVAEGRIDQARADEKLESLRDRITARVNGEGPERRHVFGPRSGN